VVAAKNLRGEAKILNYEQSVKSLIFIFSVECDACKAQFPQWNRLANQSQSNGFQVVGIVVNRPEVAKRGLVNQEARFEILIPDDFAIQRAFRSASLPLTVIVSSQGRVEWFKYGVLSDKDYQKISSLLQTQ
jgi:peroxiredoxin